MKDPVQAPGSSETDADRKRRLARARQRRHREKMRKSSAAQDNRPAQPQQAQGPAPTVPSQPQRSSLPSPLTSTFPDQSFQQPKATGEHSHGNILQYPRNVQEHEHGDGVVGAIDTANLDHMRAQTPKRQSRRKAYYSQEKPAMRDHDAMAMSHGQQDPHQRMHSEVHSAHKQSKSQPFQFQSISPRNRPMSESHEQNRNLDHQQQQQSAQLYPGSQNFHGHQKLHSGGLRNGGIMVSAQQILPEHNTRSSIRQRQPTLSGVNHDPSDLSYSVSVLPPEQLPRRSNRNAGANGRGQQSYSHLQEVNMVQSRRVGYQQRMEGSQGHMQDGSPHRPHAHVGIGLHSPTHQPTIFVSQQLPSQSPQPPPLQSQHSRSRSTEPHRQERVYSRRDGDHSFQQRRSMADDELQVGGLEAGRHGADLGRSSRRDDYRYGARQYAENPIPAFLESNIMGSLPLRTADRQSILNEQHLQDRNGGNRQHRSGQGMQGQGQMRKPDIASHHQAAQQRSLDSLAFAQQVTGPPFSLASQEPTVTGYLQTHQAERQAAAQLGPPSQNVTQSQAMYMQHTHASASSQQHTPPMASSKTDSLVAAASAAANLAALPTSVNGMHGSAGLEANPENGAQRSQPGFVAGLNFPAVFPQGSMSKDVKVTRSRSGANFLEAVNSTTANGVETSEDRKRRLARERQRRRRKRIKLGTSGNAEEGKGENTSGPGIGSHVAVSQGNYSLNANPSAALVTTPEVARIPQMHVEAPDHVSFGQEQLPNDQQGQTSMQHLPIAVGSSKQRGVRGSYDDHALGSTQNRPKNGPPPAMPVSALPQFSGTGTTTPVANPNITTEEPPANETAEERKRRLARERQRRRRLKLRTSAKAERGNDGEALSNPPINATVGSGGTRTSSEAMITNVAPTSRALRQGAMGSSGPVMNNITNAPGTRLSRHGGIEGPVFSGRHGGSQQVFGDEQGVTRVNTSDRAIASNLNAVQSRQAIAAANGDVSGAQLGLSNVAGSGRGRASAGKRKGLIRWDEVYRTEAEARTAVDTAVTGFQRNLESLSEEERMFVLQHGIVKLAMKEGLPREKLNAILVSAVSSD